MAQNTRTTFVSKATQRLFSIDPCTYLMLFKTESLDNAILAF